MSFSLFQSTKRERFSKPDFWHHSSIWSLSSSLVGVRWRWGRAEGSRCRGRCASCWPGGLCKRRSWGNGGRSRGASGCRSGTGPPRTSGCWVLPGSCLFLLWPASPDSPGMRTRNFCFFKTWHSLHRTFVLHINTPIGSIYQQSGRSLFGFLTRSLLHM